MRDDAPPDVKDAIARAVEAARPAEARGIERDVRLAGVLGAVLRRPPPAIRIGPWEIVREVGRGGMGVVYRARDPDTGEPVAIKLLSRELRHERLRFQREAALLRRVTHERVVRYVAHGITDDDQDYLVMAWLDGEDLGERLRRGVLPVAAALELAIQVAGGLGAAHRAGIVHRDVKPANVFLVGGALDDARVVDFGIAQADGPADEARLTSTSAVLGTPHYMAPEQIRGEVTPRTDVYALGALLFEALTGRPPFSGDRPATVLLAIAAEPAPSVTGLRPEVPPGVDALIGRMLAKDPASRPHDMEAVVVALADLLVGDAPVAVSRAEVAPSRAPREAAPVGATVGRERELGAARGLLAECVEERVGVGVWVGGPPGAGRTTVLRALAEGWGGRVRFARCVADGVPFSVLRRLLAGGEGRFLDDRDGDPRVVADRLRVAWLDHLDAWRAAPTLLCVDDADLADVSSLRYLRLALDHLADAPFAVVAAGATAPAVLGALHEVPLRPMGPRALARLARAWAPDHPHADDWVAMCGGSPGELRRLCTGGPAWSRLSTLDPDERRLARACALAGPVVEPGAVAALIGEPVDLARLDGLVRAGLLRVDGREVGFVSEAAWAHVEASCTPEDRQRAAWAMASWLAGRGRPAERARHLRRAGATEAAAGELLDAARLAVVGDDPALAQRYVDEASGCATGDDRAELRLLEAQIAFWRGDLAGAVASAEAARADTRPGDLRWIRATAALVTARGQRAENAEVDRLIREVLTHPAAPGAEDARHVALCRGYTQLETAGYPGTRALWDAIGDAPPDAGAEARAWHAKAQGTGSGRRSFDGSITAMLAAHRAHLQDGDPRSAALVSIYLGSYYVWSGAWELASDAIEDAQRLARRLGATYLEVWARYARGKLWVELDPARADAELAAVRRDTTGSPRIHAGAALYGALAALRLGDLDEADALATVARGHDAVALAADAARVLVAVARGDDVPEAGLVAPDGGPIVEWDELVQLARIEAAHAIGRGEAEVVREALARLHARADTLADPLRRNQYLARPHLVVRTLAWAASRR